MNLWVNRVRQLSVLAIALFFYSCVDEANLIGFKPPNSKFGVKYIEIPLDSSSVFLIDSIYTQNTGQNTSETNRLLVGAYVDPKFGKAKSIAFAQYTYTAVPDTIKSIAVFDSLELYLQFDYYVYGSPGVTNERYYIHELTDTITSNYYPNLASQRYVNSSSIAYNPTPLAIKDTVVSYTYFQEQAAKSTGKKIGTIHTKLDDEFGQRIFNFAKNNRVDFLNDVKAKAFFKGLAIVPDGANSKVIGFSPKGVAEGSAAAVVYSRMTLHYHDDADTMKINFVFYGNSGTSTYVRGITTFNNIKVDRSSATELTGHPLYTSFVPTDDLLYNQSGDGIITSINFGNFYDFADSYLNLDSTMIINSGELIIDGVVQEDGLKPINSFYLRVLEDNNRFKVKDGVQDSLDLLNYRVNPTRFTLSHPYYLPNYPGFTVLDDSNAPVVLSYSENTYKTHMTLFLQALFNDMPSKPRYRNYALFPVSPQRGKAVNRTVFNRNNIKLRIYYTVPTVKD